MKIAMTQLIPTVVCSECGQLRINTPTGMVCPNGHGRIHPRVSVRMDRLRRAFWARSFPVARQVKGPSNGPRVFEVEGRPGRFEIATFKRKETEASQVREIEGVAIPTGAEPYEDCLFVIICKPHSATGNIIRQLRAIS